MAEPTQIKGVTRTMSDVQPPVEASIFGQSLSLVLFVVALLPPMVLVLLRELSGRGSTIPYSGVWAWGALGLAVVSLVRAAVMPGTATRAKTLTSLIGPVVLLTLAVVVLVLHLHHVASLPLAVTQIVVYCLCAFSLLLSRAQI